MKIVISSLPDGSAVVLDRLTGVIVAGDDGSDAASVVAHAEGEQLAELGAVILMSIRQKLGSATFENIVRAARGAKYVGKDYSPRSTSTDPEH